MTESVLEFSDLYLVSKGALNHGRLRLQREKITFKGTRSGKVETVDPAGLEQVTWMSAPKGWEMALVSKSGMSMRLQGFKETDGHRLQSKVQSWYHITWKELERSVRGLSYGKAEFRGASMKFMVDDKPAFELPLSSVCQTTMNKTEVHLELHPNDEADVQLVEMRFVVPPSTGSTSDAIVDDTDRVKEFHDKIAAHADILRVSGDALITFDEMSCLVPRGRYTVKVYPSFLFLHGKSFDFTVPFQSIVRLFLLPHSDMRQMYFVVAMDPPMRQGQTRYPFLIFLLNKDETMEGEMALSEEEVKEKFGGKLTKNLSGPVYEVLSRIMKSVAEKKIIVPGTFNSQRGGSCIGCSYKANHGMLFPLEKGFVFVHKPALHVRFDEVVAVNFSRGGTGSTRSFDFELEVKNNVTHIFQSMNKEEYSRLYDFAVTKKLRIRNKGGKSAGMSYRGDDFDDDDSDQDAYLQKMKAEGAARMDDTDSDDSSYVAEGSAEDSAADLEFDSDAVLSDDDESTAKTVPAADQPKAAKSKKPKESKTKESKTKESKTKESKTKESKPKAAPASSVKKTKFKSAEEISSDESSDEDRKPPAKKAKKSAEEISSNESSDEDRKPPAKKVRKEPAQKDAAKKSPVKKAPVKNAPAKESLVKKAPVEEEIAESSEEEEVEEMADDEEEVPAPTRSMRSRRGQAPEELAALPSDGSNDEEDAELTSGESDASAGGDGDNEDDEEVDGGDE